MRKFVLLIVFSFFLLAGCVEKSSNLTNDYKVDNAKVFRDSFAIRGKTIPLPPGDWKIMASGLDAEKFFVVFLIQEHPGKLFSFIGMSVDSIESERERGYSAWSEINRKDIHHVVSIKSVPGEEQEGWVVNNCIPEFVSDKKITIQDAAAYIKSNGLVISNDMIKVSHFLTGKHPNKKRQLRVDYAYNPETAGFSPGQKSTWTTSDWNAVRINADSRKVEYVNELIKKHEIIHQQIKAGFHPN